MEPNPSDSEVCDICNKIFTRKSDLGRHQKTHALNKSELMHRCTHPGCTYEALQASNLRTHMNTHTGLKPKKCPTKGCGFRCGDPASLTRHRIDMHDYTPRPNSRNRFSTRTQTTTGKSKKSKRFSPYSTTSPSSCSGSSSLTSSSNASPEAHYTPPPPVPESLNQLPTPSFLPGDGSQVYLAPNGEIDNSHVMPNMNSEFLNLPPTSGLLMAPEAPVVNYTGWPVPNFTDLFGVDLSADLSLPPLAPLLEDTHGLVNEDFSFGVGLPAYASGPSLQPSVDEYAPLVNEAHGFSFAQYIGDYAYDVNPAPVSSLIGYLDGNPYGTSEATAPSFLPYEHVDGHALYGDYHPTGTTTQRLELYSTY